jgi:DNA primase
LDQGAKYINTPETMVYSKGKVLFGFNETKDAIKEVNQAFLVEGNMDMIMGFQTGIKNIVAVSGTALTDDQLILLKRVCGTLVMNFDMDTAGEMATDRSIALASTKGFNIQIVKIPDGKDLADYCLSHSHQALELGKAGTDIMSYYFSQAFQIESKTIEDKKKALAYLLPRIKVLPNVLERNVWLEKLSARLGIEQKMLFEEFNRTLSLLEYISSVHQEKTIGESLFTRSRWEALGEMILALASRFPEYQEAVSQSAEYFPGRYQDYLPRLAKENSSQDDQEFSNYLLLLAEYELSLWGEESESKVGTEIKYLFMELKKEKIRREMRDISVAIQEAEGAGNHNRASDLTKMLQQKSQELVGLNAE